MQDTDQWIDGLYLIFINVIPQSGSHAVSDCSI